VSSLKAYRDGDRTDPIMAPMAKGLSNTDIANLASYLTRLKMTDSGDKTNNGESAAESEKD